MRNKDQGYVSNIHFRNVVLEGKPGPCQIQISGADEQLNVRDVAFEDVTISGVTLAPGSKRLTVGPHVSGVRFSNGSSAAPAPLR
jgi:hypothetical protein